MECIQAHKDWSSSKAGAEPGIGPREARFQVKCLFQHLKAQAPDSSPSCSLFLQTEVSLRKHMKRKKSWAACSCLHDWSMELGFHGWHQTFSRLLGNLSKKLFFKCLGFLKLTKEQENHSLYPKTVLRSDTSYILRIIHIICGRESVADWH